jgi:hypothetical protein
LPPTLTYLAIENSAPGETFNPLPLLAVSPLLPWSGAEENNQRRRVETFALALQTSRLVSLSLVRVSLWLNLEFAQILLTALIGHPTLRYLTVEAPLTPPTAPAATSPVVLAEDWFAMFYNFTEMQGDLVLTVVR